MRQVDNFKKFRNDMVVWVEIRSILLFCYFLSVGLWADSKSDYIVPISNSEAWHSIKFRQYPLNTFEYHNDKLIMRVSDSAGPLVHSLTPPGAFSRLTVSGFVQGRVNYPKDCKIDSKECDDFLLRAGVVYSGKKKLNALQRLVAPDWIRQLSKKLSTDSSQGLGLIRLALLGQNPPPSWHERPHPDSNLFYESFESFVEADSKKRSFKMSLDLDPNKTILGIWLGSDGALTKSRFETHIHSLFLEK